MKFPISIIDKDEYLKKIDELLKDEDTILFLDTNILALLFRINLTARIEFYAWIDELIKKDKVKVPVWVINEYSKRFVRQKTSDYLDGGSSFSTIQKQFNELAKFLKLHVDENRVEGTNYTNSSELTADLDATKESFNRIGSIFKLKMNDYIYETHDEIVGRFEKLCIDSDIFDIANEIDLLGDSRYSNELPPGFEDDKEFNAHGDLIIWTEILKYSKTNKKKKVILLTNDNKRDWMYSPPKIKENGRVKYNPNQSFKIADPRLIYEFKLHTESEEFYIINFETLTKLLIASENSKFFSLAKALQLIESDYLHDKKENQEDQEIVLEVEDESETGSSTGEVLDNGYSDCALSDSDFCDYDNSELSNIILKFKSSNWYKQNDALETFLEINFDVIEINQHITDLIFVIGRNIYQSACGGAYYPIDFINNLESCLDSIPKISNDLLNGILYEIYFDSHAHIREDYKNAFYQAVLKLGFNPKYSASFEFIESELSKIEGAIYLIPSEVVEKKDILVDFIQTQGGYFALESVKFQGVELLKNNDGEHPFFNFRILGNRLGVENYICKKYAFLDELINFNYTKPYEDGILYHLEHKIFK